MDTNNVDFNENHLSKLEELGKYFKGKENIIIDFWGLVWDKSSCNNLDKEKTVRIKEGIEKLIYSFTSNISRRDISTYLKDNVNIGKFVARESIGFDYVMDAFHYFEDSYVPLIEEMIANNGEEPLNILGYFDSMDKLHHKSISIIAEQYFLIKDATILALAKLVEKRDYDTGMHLDRVREYTRIISRKLNQNESFIRKIYIASGLHDIGKIAVPDHILLKPERLTKEEFEIMKTHTKVGADTIREIINDQGVFNGQLIIAEEIARYHHENYDGSGYYGLKGDEIPLSARIFSIGDIYDALTTKRPYKIAFSHEEASRIILEGDNRTMPRHFDPDVLNAFKNSLEEFEEICINYRKS